MFVHSVYFWLKSGLDEKSVQLFESEIQKLKEIESAKAVYIGSPAQTDRPVIEKSYSFALTVVLDSLADHDAYQVDPIHKGFLAKCSQFIEKVLIYDAD